MGCFMYCIFGSTKDVTVGPTAIMALMTAEKADFGSDFAVLLAFTTGIIVFLFGILKLGKSFIQDLLYVCCFDLIR